MRPMLLELQGFGPFRDAATIDFRDHDLIAFTGPTGAGKSTIIDGIAFALYGSVARYDNEKLVAPIINAVSTEARVRLDFVVNKTSYTAVRVVRRAGNRASTKEARLESGDEVLASTAQDVTKAVERLIGLSFSQFTKTVVLPQGEFAQFLNVKPSARQGLLRRMLGLDLYSTVGKVARLRSRDLKIQMETYEKTISDEKSSISKLKIDKLRAVMDKLDTQLEQVNEATVEQEAAIEQLDEVTSTIDSLEQRIAAVEDLTLPADTKTFSARVEKATAAVQAAQAKLDAETEKHQAAAAARSELPSHDDLAQLLADHDALGQLTTELAALAGLREKAAAGLEKAVAKADDARSALVAAEETLEHARILAGAGGIAATLHIGDECPVCAQLVEDLPKVATAEKRSTALSKAEAARDAARRKAQQVVEEVQAATAAKADATARHENAEAAVDAMITKLDGQPTHKQALALRKRASAADGKVETAHDRLVAATLSLEDATAVLDESKTSESAMRRAFTAARDSVTMLQPPTPSEEAVHDDWVDLVNWGKETAKALKAELREHRKERTAVNNAKTKADKALARLGTPYFPPNAIVDPDRAAAMVRNAHADARLEFANAEDRWNRQEAIREQMGDLSRRRALTEELGKHLMAGMFERWIMGDVMNDLAERASVQLLQLSDGAFSLITDGRDFQIRDHRNADEVRNARTLSGGETFLTSLSLALALSDSITELAASTTPPLESMFLDEGFGTLDAETLDVVATAIEDLGASGRLIGIVTHIPDLAERIPTQVHVSPGPTGSKVTVR